MKKSILLAMFFICFFCFKISYSADNQDVLKIYKNIRCLVCQGQSIYDSNSDFAETIKIVVNKKIEE